MTTAYKITWPSGASTIEHSECETVAAYMMSRWGTGMEKVLADHGTKVELAQEEETSVSAKSAAIAASKAAHA